MSMENLIENIISYLKYLNSYCGLNVSVHFDKSIFDCLPGQIVSLLLPYNSHINPYCTIVKATNHNKCLQDQKDILKKCRKDESFCRICHAGVCEYIYPIYKNETTVGFAAVSGYRQKELPNCSINNTLWKKVLDDKGIPLELCNTVIPPLAIMLEQLLLNYSKSGETEYNLILQFLNEYHVNITLADLSKHFNRSKSHISHLFKNECGISIRAYCNNLKLEDAKNLLINTDIPVTEIAFDIGFNDPSYFIYLFRKKFGTSPLQYRKLNRLSSENNRNSTF